MIEFDPENPFPLLDLDNVSYADAQAHSERVDAWLGLKPQEIEKSIERENLSERDRRERWIDLPPSALLTPYVEIRSMLSQVGLKPGDHVVDLGAGYGRMAFVLAKHFPECHFTGYELVEERVRAAREVFKRSGLTGAEMIATDIAAPEFEIPQAAIFFIYDFGTRESVEKVLQNLKVLARSQTIAVIGRGGRVRDLIEKENFWLSGVVDPLHFPHFSIYRSSRT